MRILLKVLITALALIAVAYLLPGVSVTGPYVALIVAVLLGILNLVIRPVLILFTLPINILTLGLFTFVINGFLFWFVATFVEGFAVERFTTAVLGALIVSLVSWLGEKVLIHDHK
jgi:putative membrane protein